MAIPTPKGTLVINYSKEAIEETLKLLKKLGYIEIKGGKVRKIRKWGSDHTLALSNSSFLPRGFVASIPHFAVSPFSAEGRVSFPSRSGQSPDPCPAGSG